MKVWQIALALVPVGLVLVALALGSEAHHVLPHWANVILSASGGALVGSGALNATVIYLTDPDL